MYISIILTIYTILPDVSKQLTFVNRNRGLLQHHLLRKCCKISLKETICTLALFENMKNCYIFLVFLTKKF